MPQKPDFNSSREYLYRLINENAASLPEGALVLDAGAGNSPYQALFSRVKYESADFCQVNKEYSNVTYVCDLKAIPVESNRYDMVLLTQVLEHISEPKDVLREIHRVLKPNGKFVLSAPFFYEEHETPFDFYRYTQFGFRYLLEDAKFKVKSINWLEGYYGTLSYQLKTAVKSLPRNPKHYGGGIAGVLIASLIFLIKPVLGLLADLLSHLDIKNKFTSAGYCKNYSIIAIKE